MLKHKRIRARQCDWCKREIILNGPNADPFVVTGEWKHFCIVQTPGQPAERDCMADYLNDLKRKPHELSIKKELEKEEKQKQKEEEKEKKIKLTPGVLAKLDALRKEFKDRARKERLSNHLT